ncbi:MAG: HlyD family secretion protein [Nitrococcus sp.]|nr:HlyD family secretion protein [Nitrococcus sp.]
MTSFLSRRWLKLPIPRPSRSAVRRLLLMSVPVVVAVIACYFYILGGRYVSTENAYINADMVRISAQVDGPITRVAVAENEPVRQGALLFQIDPAPYRIALRSARAKLEQARGEIKTLKASYRQAQESLQLAKLNVAYAEREYQRQLALARRHVTSQAQLDRYRHERDVAKEKVAGLGQELARIRASLNGDPDIPVEQHPRYLAAKAACDAAALDLRRTWVRAPFDGVAAKVPNPGAQVTAGKPVMSLIAKRGVWIVANFKETALTHVRPGQPVSIEVDTYPDHHWHGHVQSIAQATGAVYSLLPAQNATGNWVKVVQRIPVRIAIDDQAGGPALRAGMSVTSEIDTGYHPRGPDFLAPAVAWARTVIAPAQARSGS